MRKNYIYLSFLFFGACQPSAPPETVSSVTSKSDSSASWMLGQFVKQDAVNPVLNARESSTFLCPIRDEEVFWESKDVFNPATVVLNDTLFLLYRAEDRVGKLNGTSRIGLAYSTDGRQFVRYPQPVLYPDHDLMEKYEWEGGIEDPRIVEDELGRYYLTYTAYHGGEWFIELAVATSDDLLHWQKEGPCFDRFYQAQPHVKHLEAKAGAVVTRQEGSRFIATKVQGKYWMYWFDYPVMRAATSDDLIHWQPVMENDTLLKTVLHPRPGFFDSRLTEPGPPAIITDQGILLIYNGMNLPADDPNRDLNIPPDTYSGGQVLFDLQDPTKVIQRSEQYFITPDKDYELAGQVNRVCFLEGLAYFQDKYWLYYGTADSKIAVTVTE